jgi:hypothetical protein
MGFLAKREDVANAKKYGLKCQCTKHGRKLKKDQHGANF